MVFLQLNIYIWVFYSHQSILSRDIISFALNKFTDLLLPHVMLGPCAPSRTRIKINYYILRNLNKITQI